MAEDKSYRSGDYVNHPIGARTPDRVFPGLATEGLRRDGDFWAGVDVVVQEPWFGARDEHDGNGKIPCDVARVRVVQADEGPFTYVRCDLTRNEDARGVSGHVMLVFTTPAEAVQLGRMLVEAGEKAHAMHPYGGILDQDAIDRLRRDRGPQGE